jgi:catechol 2,3-dioxygenase-like lactoylglutathione lyase family enzyme
MRESIRTIVIACMLLTAIAVWSRAQSGPMPSTSGKILGVAFDGLQVANLERSIAFYELLGFKLTTAANPTWHSDESINQLCHTRGASSRSAALTMPSIASGKPFTLLLHEYKGIARTNRAALKPRDPGASHFCVTVPDADAVWAKLQSAGVLRSLTWDGQLRQMPGPNGVKLAYIMDPDDMNIEIAGPRAAVAATATNPAVPASPTGFNHIGLVIFNTERSKKFFGEFLSAQFATPSSEWLSGDMYDSVVGGHGYVIKLTNGTFAEAAAGDARMRLELVEYQKPNREKAEDFKFTDIGVNYVGLEVSDLGAVYTRLKNAGALTWSDGGVATLRDGTRAVIVRDPEVGAFAELFEKAKK